MCVQGYSQDVYWILLDWFEAESRDVQDFAAVSAWKWGNEDLQAGQEAKSALYADPQSLSIKSPAW